MKRNANTARQQSGFSLVESLLGVAITSLALGAGLPGFEAAKEKRHLDGSAAQLETDIQLARSEAVKLRHTLRLTFATSSAGSCYVVHTGKATDCSCTADGNSSCKSNATAYRAAGFKAGGDLQMSSNVTSIVFDPVQGTITPTGTFRFMGPKRNEVRVVVSIMGRARLCTPTRVPGYTAC